MKKNNQLILLAGVGILGYVLLKAEGVIGGSAQASTGSNAGGSGVPAGATYNSQTGQYNTYGGDYGG